MSNLMPGMMPDDGLSEWEIDRLCDIAREKAADDPDLGFPAAGDVDTIELDGPDVDPVFGGYAFTATYQGCSVTVYVDADYLLPNDEP